MNTITILVIAFVVNVVAFGSYIKANKGKWFSGMFIKGSTQSRSLLTSMRSSDIGFVFSILGLGAFAAGFLLSIRLIFIGGFLASILGQLFSSYRLGLYWGPGMLEGIRKLPGVWRVFAGFLFGLFATSLNIAWYFG